MEKWNKDIKDTSEYTPSEIATLHTLSKIKDFSEIHAEGKKEGDELFLKKTRELWKEFAVHGTAKPDGKGGFIIKPKTDLDGRGFIEVLKQAGLDTSKVEYLAHDKYLKGGYTGDASGRDGVSTPDAGESQIDDHHGEKSGRDTSATKIAYEKLVDFGLIGKDAETIKRFVDLVTDEDNQNYTDKEVKYLFDPKNRRFSRTIIGLSEYLTTDQIMDLLDKNKDYKKALPPKVLKSIKGSKRDADNKITEEKTLEEFSEDKKGHILNAERDIRNMSKAGFEIDSGTKFGKILIDTGRAKVLGNGKEIGYSNKIGMGNESFLPVRAAGYGAYVIWIPEQNRFKIFTEEPLGDVEFDQGRNTRGYLWSKHGNDGEDLAVTLEEILSKLCGKDIKIDGELKEAIDNEKKEREDLQKEVKDMNKLIEELQEKINPANFDKKTYGKKNSDRALELNSNLKKIVEPKVGQNKGYMQWPQKVAAIESIRKSIDAFIARAEKEKGQERLAEYKIPEEIIMAYLAKMKDKKRGEGILAMWEGEINKIIKKKNIIDADEAEIEALNFLAGKSGPIGKIAKEILETKTDNKNKAVSSDPAGELDAQGESMEELIGKSDTIEGPKDTSLDEQGEAMESFIERQEGDAASDQDEPDGSNNNGTRIPHRDPGDIVINPDKPEGEPIERKYDDLLGATLYNKDSIKRKNADRESGGTENRMFVGNVEVNPKKKKKQSETGERMFVGRVQNEKRIRPDDWIRIESIDYKKRKAVISYPGLKNDGVGISKEVERKSISFRKLENMLKKYAKEVPPYDQLKGIELHKKNSKDPRDWMRVDEVDYENKKVRISYPGLRNDGVGISKEIENRTISFMELDKRLEEYTVGNPWIETPDSPGGGVSRQETGNENNENNESNEERTRSAETENLEKELTDSRQKYVEKENETKAAFSEIIKVLGERNLSYDYKNRPEVSSARELYENNFEKYLETRLREGGFSGRKLEMEREYLVKLEEIRLERVRSRAAIYAREGKRRNLAEKFLAESAYYVKRLKQFFGRSGKGIKNKAEGALSDAGLIRRKRSSWESKEGPAVSPKAPDDREDKNQSEPEEEGGEQVSAGRKKDKKEAAKRAAEFKKLSENYDFIPGEPNFQRAFKISRKISAENKRNWGGMKNVELTKLESDTELEVKLKKNIQKLEKAMSNALGEEESRPQSGESLIVWLARMTKKTFEVEKNNKEK